VIVTAESLRKSCFMSKSRKN